MSQSTVSGYRKRPWELTLLAVFFALVPFLGWVTRYVSSLLAGRGDGPLQVLAGYFAAAGLGPVGLFHSLLMAGLWVLFLVVAWGIFRVARWGFFLCIVAAVANSLFSMVFYSVTVTPAGPQEILGIDPFQTGVLLNLVFFIPVVMVLRQKIMAPFFNPRLRWWEQHPRVKAQLRIEASVGGQTREYRSFDISASGMFLGTGVIPDLKVGDTFPAVVHLGETDTRVDLECQAVWISDGKGRTPVGCGVTFTYRQRGQRRALKHFIRARIKEGQVLERT